MTSRPAGRPKQYRTTGPRQATKLRAAANGSGSIEKALDVLACFKAADSELGVSEIGRRLSFGVSTVHRLLNRMMAKGFIRQNPVTQRYALGPSLLDIARGMLGDRQLSIVALPSLIALRDVTGETARLHVRIDSVRVCVSQVESREEIRAGGGIGKEYPLYAGAASKVILAFLPRAEQERVLQDVPTTPRAPNMIVSPELMQSELETIRRLGFAVSQQENSPDGSSVAAPIRDLSGAVIAALSINGPSGRLNRAAAISFGPVVVEQALEVSLRLGKLSEHET